MSGLRTPLCEQLGIDFPIVQAPIGAGTSPALAAAVSGAGIHGAYRRRVLDATETSTVHTDIFDGGWPDGRERVIANEIVRRWEAAGRPPPARRPDLGQVVARRGDGSDIPAYSVAMPVPGMEGNLGDMANYAGQSAGLVHEVLPAAEIVARIAADAERVLSSAGSGRTGAV